MPVAGRLLEVDEVHRRFGERTALDGLSFSVAPVRTFGFLGPNGAGKTTCVRIIMGNDRADDGEVRWAGQPVDEDRRAPFGHMPGQRGLYPKMKVRKQLIYVAMLHGFDATGAEYSVDGCGWIAWLSAIGATIASTPLPRQPAAGPTRRSGGAQPRAPRPGRTLLEPRPDRGEAMVEVLQERAAAGASVGECRARSRPSSVGREASER